MHKLTFGLRAAAFAAMFALIAGTSLQAQEEGGGRGARGQRGGGGGGQRGQRGGGQRGQRGGGQRGGGQRGFGGQRGGGGGTMSKVDLLRMEEVQKELKLGDDVLETVNGAVQAYRDQVREITDGMRDDRPEFDRESFRDAEKLAAYRKEMAKYQEKITKKTAPVTKETEEILAAILSEEQWKRLGELEVQSMMQSGVLTALLNKDFAAKLKVTKEQTTKLETLKKDSDKASEEATTKMREQMRAAFSGGGGGDFRAMMEEAQKAGQERQKKVGEKATSMLTDEQKKMMAEMKGKEFKFPERRGRNFGGGRGGRDGGGGRGGRDAGGGRGGRPSTGRPGRPGGDGGAAQ